MSFRPGTRRYTIECIRAGQPRPYADTEHVYQVLFEHVPYFGNKTELEPYVTLVELKYVREVMNGLQLGIGPDTLGAEKGFETYIDYIRQIPSRPGVWEIRTVTPFTD